MSPQAEVDRLVEVELRARRFFNPYLRSPQARGVFADPDEVKSHRWVLIQPPVAWFHDGGDPRRGARRDINTWIRDVESDSAAGAFERERVQSIAEWTREKYGGDLNKLLFANPLLAFRGFADDEEEDLDGLLVDGWHRLYIWAMRVSREVGPLTLVGVPR